MKKVILILIVAVGCLMSKPSSAQVSVNINIGVQPVWGPVGYDYVEYYYLPEVDAYYYVPGAQFIYLNGGQWVFVNSLPSSHYVNLYSTYIVVVNEPKPYLQHNIYFTKYGKFKHSGRKFITIKDSHEEKYFVVKGHAKHGSGEFKEKRNEGYKEKNNSNKPAGEAKQGGKFKQREGGKKSEGEYKSQENNKQGGGKSGGGREKSGGGNGGGGHGSKK